MKKGILILCLLVAIFGASAQVSRNIIKSQKFFTVTAQYMESVNVEEGAKYNYVVLLFKNMEYPHLSKYSSILIADPTTLNQFIIDLRTANDYLKAKNNIDINRGAYSLNVYDFSSTLYIGTPANELKGWNNLGKKHTSKLIQWLESVTL